MAEHPPPPGAAAHAKKASDAEPSSEALFKRRLIKALRTANFRELRALWHDPQLEPHMTLFVLLVAAFLSGAIIWIVEPMFI